MKYVTTKTTAAMLGVSTTTIRRYANAGLISSRRLANSQHRRFEISEINRFLNNIETRERNNYNMDKATVINPSPHPKHYLMHKYWGRKAHNVINDYINKYTSKNQTVLDPFMGSGVVVIEAAKLGRKAIGIDINPLSKLIVDNSVSQINLEDLKFCYLNIYQKMKAEFAWYYQTECPKCKKLSEIELVVWKNNIPEKLRLKCPIHGIENKVLDSTDKKRLHDINIKFNQLKKGKKLKYPNEKIFKYVKRSGVSSIEELYTPRALIILSFLLREINKVRNRPIKECLRFIFSSMLPNVSRMIPGDLQKVTYKSGWVISKFWVPKINTERSILHCLNLRFYAILEGKQELSSIQSSLITTHVSDSKKLKIKSNSIDYILTDPPYGESIAYLALSHFWNSWLCLTPDYRNEIIIDPYRNLSISEYSKNIYFAFKEFYRVLKPGKYLSFTFHNRDLNVWKGILEACLKSGFILKDITLQPQAVSSGTQGINRKNTLKGDFIYIFTKPKIKNKNISLKYMNNSNGFIVNKIHSFLSKHSGATSAKLYEFIIPEIVKNGAYLDDQGEVINLEKVIEQHFDYIKVDNTYKWISRKGPNTDNKISVVDLFSGAGGLSEGFSQAGFDVAVAIDNDPKHIDTYSHNHPDTKLVIDDIKNVAADNEIKSTFSIRQFLMQNNKKCDVVIGGPPCQGFSMAGLRIRKKYQLFSDERNYLFLEFFRIVKYLKPKVFVLENVPGILNFNNGSIKDELISKFSSIGYNVSSKILNVSDYGIPQIRKRAFFIGNSLGLSSNDLFPEQTHKNNKITIWEAISDLPIIHSGEGSEVMKYANTRESMTNYQQMMRLECYDGEIYNHQASNHSKSTLEILKMIQPGKGLKDLEKKYQTHSVHSGAYGRMEKNKPAYTLTTRLNTPSVGRITHPILDRTITVREAARIQSFSDNYRFFGDITSQGIQVGNSVPPLLAKTIALTIKNKCFNVVSF